MSRIKPIRMQTASAATRELLDNVQKQMGMVPNIVATMAHSTAAAQGYLGFSQSLARGTLPARLREQLALVVGETNGCDYCVAAHTALGQGTGLSVQDTCDARRAEARDPREQSALPTENRRWVARSGLGELRLHVSDAWQL